MVQFQISLVAFYFVFGFMTFPSLGNREVLIRDRLVFLLCDQYHEYMSTGKFPEPVKVMPDKYKSIRPGAQAFEIKPNMTGIKQKALGENGSRVKRFSPMEYPQGVIMLDFWDRFNFMNTGV